MKMVVLDGFTLNPGDLTWEGIEQFGELKVFDRTDFCSQKSNWGHRRCWSGFYQQSAHAQEVIEQAPNLKYIGVLATGYNIIALEKANELGVLVTNVPTYGTNGVAQFTMALLLEMCHHVGDHNKAVHHGDWAKSLDFCFWNSPLIELRGKTLGIIGFGRIGQATAKMAQTL